MATGVIQEKSVDDLPTPIGPGRAYLWDTKLTGFGVMVTPKGVKSYIVQYRIGGRGQPTRRYTIGRHGNVNAAQARIRAREILDMVWRRVDPVDADRAKIAERNQARVASEAEQAVASRLGFSVFADRFIEKYAKVQQERSWRETDGIVRRDLKPAFGDKPLTAIRDHEITELLDEIGERSPSAALKAYKALRLIFAFASDKERRYFKAGASPMLGIKPPSKATTRQRTLTDSELRLAWIAAGSLGWPFGPIVRLLILTMQRRDEVGGLVWGELDIDGAAWVIPGERTKNRNTHFVPLAAAVVTILRELPRIKSKPGLLFTTTGDTPVSGFSKVKARLDKLMQANMRAEAIEGGMDESEAKGLTIPPWTFHDLRRTGATGCQRLGVKIEVTEAVLNHVSGTTSDLVGVYQTYKYADEKRAALDVWARHVLAVVSGQSANNVVPLALARG